MVDISNLKEEVLRKTFQERDNLLKPSFWSLSQRNPELAEQFINKVYALIPDSQLIDPRFNVSQREIYAVKVLWNVLYQIFFAQKWESSGKTLFPSWQKKTAETTATLSIEKTKTKEVEELDINKIRVPNCYKILGVDENASSDEIKKAFREKLKNLHPDLVDKLWREGKISEEEYRERTRNAQDLIKAYEAVSNEENRNIYDQVRKAETVYPETSETVTPGVVPLIPTVVGVTPPQKHQEGLTIEVHPKVLVSNIKKSQLDAPTQSFRDNLLLAGSVFSLTPEEIAGYKILGLIPKDFSNAQANASARLAMNLFAKGAKSTDFEQALDTIELPAQAKRTGYFAAFVLRSFETVNPREAELIHSAAGQPNITITNTATPNPSGLQISLTPDGAGLVLPAMGIIKGQAFNLAKKGVKKVFGKALKEGGKKLAATGIKLAAKAGIDISAQALGTTFPIIGNIIAFVATEVLPRVLGFVNKAINSFLTLLTGEKDKRKQMFYLLGMATVGFMALGMPIAAVASGLGTLGMGLSVTGGKAIASGVTGIGQAIAAGAAALIPSFAMTVIFAIIAVPIIVALILFIINSSAFVVPRGGFNITTIYVASNPYIKVEKVALSSEPFKSPASAQIYKNSDLKPLLVIYRITITALQDTLTNVKISYDCKVEKRDNSSVSCPTNPTIPLPDGGIISPTDPFTFSYPQSYSSGTYNDSLVYDTITVTADAPGAANQSSSATASLCIGNCPEECPSNWPTAHGYLTQGAYATPTDWSHHTMEAIDIGVVNVPVTATHTGRATVLYNTCIGNYVQIESVCQGRSFFSQFAHLSAVDSSINGTMVTKGRNIGISGNTGSCTTGPHLHYRFRYTNLTDPSYPGNPPFMWTNFIPKNVPRGCWNTATCATSW